MQFWRNLLWKIFCLSFNFKNLVQEPTYLKDPKNPIYIDFIFTYKAFPKLMLYWNKVVRFPGNECLCLKNAISQISN